MADITIGIIASAREWRSVLQAHVRDHVAGVRVQILREPRVALELDLDVVIIDDVSTFLTRDKVIRLREKGTRVVGIYDPEGIEGLGMSFLENLGVDLSLPSNISPEEMINAVSHLGPRETYANTFDSVVANMGASPYATARPTMSSMIAVSGPAGTGSTEIAIALADVLVSRRESTLLMDCDEVGPSVARRLGFHLHPNILSAIDAVSNATKPLTDMMGRPSDRGASSVSFDVLPGIANAEDWSQLRSMDLEDLFNAAKKSWRYIVCNTGPFAEDLSGYGIERFGATRSTLHDADVIIGVMSPTPTGYMRFLDWIASLRTLGADRPVCVVVNHAPKSGYIRSELESQLARDVDSRFISGLFFVPNDERVAKAEWEGQRVGRGPFLNAVHEIASYVIPQTSSGASAPVAAYTPTAPEGYTPAPVSVSWDDPDIAQAPPAQIDSPLGYGDTNVHAPPAEFSAHGGAPVDDPHISELEEQLRRSFEEQARSEPAPPPIPDIPAAPLTPPFAPPTNPGHNVGEGYVPAYKRMDESDPSAPVNDQAPIDTTQYVGTTPDATGDGQGYVPHFLDEEQGDDTFWEQQ